MKIGVTIHFQIFYRQPICLNKDAHNNYTISDTGTT